MKRAFTLIELMLAILLGAMVVMMIAGSLRSAVQAWESVEKTSALNYNRRTVLDIIKRQSSSLFYAEDAQNLNSMNNEDGKSSRPNARTARDPIQPFVKGKNSNFELPNGASYFKGQIQQIEFVSTVSFLSDFPGQVSVKYYVIQKDPNEEDPDSGGIGQTAPPPPPPPPTSLNEDGMDLDEEVEELEGNLYLVMQETNLFLNQTAPNPDAEGSDEERADENSLDQEEIPLEDVLDEEPKGTTQVMLLGPLRKFSIRYRVPGTRDVNSEEEEDDWETSWSVGSANGQYPVAIEYTLFYETPGVTDRIKTEDLDGIRMVIPVYSSSNLNERGNNHGNFFDDAK